MALSAERLLEPLFPPVPPPPSPSASASSSSTIPPATTITTTSDYGEDEGTPGVKVVWADAQGWWAPLTHLFYSNASRCLVSAHPESSVEEVESFYCPHCLTYFAEAEAATSGHRCPRCFDCPTCTSALVIVRVDGGKENKGEEEEEEGSKAYGFQCGCCRWSSAQALGLVETTPEALLTTTSKATADAPQDTRFQALLGQLKQRAMEVARDRQFRGRRLLHQTMSSAGAAATAGGTTARWYLADLAKKEAQQAAEAAATHDDVARTAVLYGLLDEASEKEAGWDGLSAEAHDRVYPPFLHLSALDTVTRATQRQAACTLHQPTTTAALYPLRRALATKRSRRCRQDVEAGRPGILLKPKINPLEGDSSMRTNIGKWWQKDVSAIHVLPFLSVLQAQGLAVGRGEGGEKETTRPPWSFVLRLRNPLNGKVKVEVVGPPPAPTQEEGEGGGGGKEKAPYYLQHLHVALGGRDNVVQVRRQEEEEAVEVELEAFEDEYLEEEEDGGDPEALDEQALRAMAAEDEGEEGATKVLRQSKYRAWLRVVVPASSASSSTVGVLLFLRLTSDRSELHGGLGSSKRGEPVSVTVPVCLAFQPRAAVGREGSEEVNN